MPFDLLANVTAVKTDFRFLITGLNSLVLKEICIDGNFLTPTGDSIELKSQPNDFRVYVAI